jgi:hypothetical protein
MKDETMSKDVYSKTSFSAGVTKTVEFEKRTIVKVTTTTKNKLRGMSDSSRQEMTVEEAEELKMRLASEDYYHHA